MDNNGNNVDELSQAQFRLHYYLRNYLRSSPPPTPIGSVPISTPSSSPPSSLLEQLTILRSYNVFDYGRDYDLVDYLAEYLHMTRVFESGLLTWQNNSLMIGNPSLIAGIGGAQTMPCSPRQITRTVINSLPSSSNSYGHTNHLGIYGGIWPHNQFYCWPISNDHASTSRNRSNEIGSSNFYDPNSGGFRPHDQFYYWPILNDHASSSRNPSNFNDPNSYENYVSGRIGCLARNHVHCGFLVELLSVGDPKDVDMIFAEAKGELASLAVHQTGSGLIQKLIDVVDEYKLEEIVSLVTTNDIDRNMLKYICSDDYGNKVLRSLIERLKCYEDMQSLLMRGLSNIVVFFTTNSYCKQALECCFSSFSYRAVQPFLEKIAAKFYAIVTNKNGCCVMQRCLTVCLEQNDTTVFNTIVARVVKNSRNLSDDPYGNYVVQFVVEMEDPNINDPIAEKLKGNFGSLSMNIASSNVVEKLIRNSGRDTVEKIIVEIADCPNLLRILQHQYGNYVAQTALKESRRQALPVYQKLYDFVMANFERLDGHVLGNAVLRAIEAKDNNICTTSHS